MLVRNPQRRRSVEHEIGIQKLNDLIEPVQRNDRNEPNKHIGLYQDGEENKTGDCNRLQRF